MSRTPEHKRNIAIDVMSSKPMPALLLSRDEADILTETGRLTMALRPPAFAPEQSVDLGVATVTVELMWGRPAAPSRAMPMVAPVGEASEDGLLAIISQRADEFHKEADAMDAYIRRYWAKYHARATGRIQPSA